MIRRLLVANRGEIARRVFATCRAMGIETVAVFSDADANAPHAREADYAVPLPGDAPGETYLRGERIVEAALRAGADAVHPGYGFLAENAEFAAAVAGAGLVWVGPPTRAIATMGSKLEAKALLAEAGVPVLPSWTEAGQVGEFPVLVKASAGGGGRGMRVVRSAAELAEALAAARREAAGAFGDGAVFCERFVPTGRHVEVQIVADTHGAVVALGERECSIQRRHQKIMEESPSPGVHDGLRSELCAAAVTGARAAGYTGAGTMEFLLAPDGRFYFLEMNTRLQVEHPVTECVTGLDLVRLQLLIAEGQPLPFTQAPVPRGHAIEVRLYAEDPRQGWRGSTGTLHRFSLGPRIADFAPLAPDGGRPGIRVDSGVERGSTVSAHYDPLLAKVIAWAPTRTEAARLLAGALARAEIHGVVTNRDLLTRVLRDPEFLAGGTDTAFLDRHSELFAPLVDDRAEQRLACLAAALAGAAARRASSVWSGLPSGWRNVPSAPHVTAFDGPSGRVDVAYSFDRDGALSSWSVGGEVRDGTSLVTASATEVILDVDGVRRAFRVHAVDTVSYVDSSAGAIALAEAPRFPLPVTERARGSLLAPMPGTVSRVAVKPGDQVDAGDLLVTLEAMKLEHPVHAPRAGILAELRVESGDQVEAGAVLAVLTLSETESEAP